MNEKTKKKKKALSLAPEKKDDDEVNKNPHELILSNDDYFEKN